MGVEPFAGLAWSDLRVRGFNESGGSAALSGQAQKQRLTTSLAVCAASGSPRARPSHCAACWAGVTPMAA